MSLISENNIHILSLPDELLGIIYKQLPPGDGLIAFSLSCKKISALINLKTIGEYYTDCTMKSEEKQIEHSEWAQKSFPDELEYHQSLASGSQFDILQPLYLSNSIFSSLSKAITHMNLGHLSKNLGWKTFHIQTGIEFRGDERKEDGVSNWFKIVWHPKKTDLKFEDKGKEGDYRVDYELFLIRSICTLNEKPFLNKFKIMVENASTPEKATFFSWNTCSILDDRVMAKRISNYLECFFKSYVKYCAILNVSFLSDQFKKIEDLGSEVEFISDKKGLIKGVNTEKNSKTQIEKVSQFVFLLKIQSLLLNDRTIKVLTWNMQGWGKNSVGLEEAFRWAVISKTTSLFSKHLGLKIS